MAKLYTVPIVTGLSLYQDNKHVVLSYVLYGGVHLQDGTKGNLEGAGLFPTRSQQPINKCISCINAED